MSARVFTTLKSGKYTLNVINEGNPVVMVTMPGPLPKELAELSERAQEGNQYAAEEFTKKFLFWWHMSPESDWLPTGGVLH